MSIIRLCSLPAVIMCISFITGEVLGQDRPAQGHELGAVIAEGQAYEAQADSLRSRALLASRVGQSTAELIDQAVGFYESAVDAYTRAIELDPTAATAFRLRALARAKRDQDANQRMILGSGGAPAAIASFGPESVADADSAVRLASMDADSYLTRAKVYELQFMNKYVVYFRTDAQTRRAIGPGIARTLGLDPTFVAHSVRDYLHALTIDPTLCEAYNRLGTLQGVARLLAGEGFALELSERERTEPERHPSCR